MMRVLVVDDEPAIREMAALALEKNGFEVELASNLDTARKLLEKTTFDLVLSDIYLRGENGLDLLREVRESHPGLHVILMTARGSVETAALAQQIGAFDYIGKPFDVKDLIDRVRAALAPVPAGVEIDAGPSSMIVGAHPSMVEVYKAIARVAKTDVPVLVTGETGTGKELVARAIHELGPGPDASFVPINCGAVPDTLLESELFGHVRGAFTDARRDRRGAFVQARGGTIFLDEIGDVSPTFQVKLLRILQDRVVTPLGADRGEQVDSRIVAATNRDLRHLIMEGVFREDLYYRLAGYEIHLPALRERKSDIPLLVEHFRSKFSIPGVSLHPPSSAVAALLDAHEWPGNVRELERFVRRMVIDSAGLGDVNIAHRILGASRTVLPSDGMEIATASVEDDGVLTLDDAERTHIVAVLEACGSNKTKAAEILGIDRKTLRRKLQRWGLDADGNDPEE